MFCVLQMLLRDPLTKVLGNFIKMKNLRTVCEQESHSIEGLKISDLMFYGEQKANMRYLCREN